MANILRKLTGNKNALVLSPKSNRRQRHLRFEPLEERALLAVTLGQIQTMYPDLDFTGVGANITEIPADYLSETRLREAITNENATSGTHLIVCHTSSVQNTISLHGSGIDVTNSVIIVTYDTSGKMQSDTLTIDADYLSGVFNVSAGGKLGLGGVTIANGAGSGAIIVSGGTLNLDRCTVTSTKAEDSSSFYLAGGIHVNSGNVAMKNSVISYTQGGMRLQNGTIKLEDCIVAYNNGSAGGAVYQTGGTLTATRCSVFGNIAENGGGLFLENGMMDVKDCIINGNKAGNGGVLLQSGGTLNVTNSEIAGNCSTSEYGIYFGGGRSTIKNVTFAGNIGSIYYNNDLTDTNCIFAFNYGYEDNASDPDYSNNLYTFLTGYVGTVMKLKWDGDRQQWVSDGTAQVNQVDEEFQRSGSQISTVHVTASIYGFQEYMLIGDEVRLVSFLPTGFTLKDPQFVAYTDYDLGMSYTEFIMGGGSVEQALAIAQSQWTPDLWKSWDLRANATNFGANLSNPVATSLVTSKLTFQASSASLTKPSVKVNVMNHDIRLKWDKVSEASAYEVYQLIGSEWLRIGITMNCLFVDKELPEGTYAYMVKAFNFFGDYSNESNVVTASPLHVPFQKDSLKGAKHTIYLDFNGHETSYSDWVEYRYDYKDGNNNNIITPAFDLDGKPESFNDEEEKVIETIWELVAEYFKPFNVNVTTIEPNIEDLRKTDENDSKWGVRVVIGGSVNDWYHKERSTTQGISFRANFTSDTDVPCFIFSNDIRNTVNTAYSIIHEVGHMLGLYEDGSSRWNFRNYYSGHNGWSPIMGQFRGKQLVQWSKGEYQNAKRWGKEFITDIMLDELAVISSTTSNIYTDEYNGEKFNNGFGYRKDDNPDGKQLVIEKGIEQTDDFFRADGIIETNADKDVFTFSLDEKSDFIFSFAPGVKINHKYFTSLYASIKIEDSSGKTVLSQSATYTPNAIIPVGIAEHLTCNFSITLAPGEYSLIVEGSGYADPKKDGFSEYGSIGSYSFAGFVRSSKNQLPQPKIMLAEAAEIGQCTLGWTPVSAVASDFAFASSSAASSYALFRKRVEDEAFMLVYQGTDTYFVDTDLLGNTTYTYVVQALGDNAISDFSDPVTITTLPDGEPVTEYIVMPESETANHWTVRKNIDVIEIVNALDIVEFSKTIDEFNRLVVYSGGVANDNLTVDFSYGGSFTVENGIYFIGTDSQDESFSFIGSEADDILQINIDVTEQDYGGLPVFLDSIEHVTIDGKDGDDQIWMDGSDGNDTFTFARGITEFSTANTKFETVNVEEVFVNSQAGNDSATVLSTDFNNLFTLTDNFFAMSGGGYRLELSNFNNIEAIAAGRNDKTYVYGENGSFIAMTDHTVERRTQDQFYRVWYSENVTAINMDDANNSILHTGSRAYDEYTLTTGYGVATNAIGSYRHEFIDFENIVIFNPMSTPSVSFPTATGWTQQTDRGVWTQNGYKVMVIGHADVTTRDGSALPLMAEPLAKTPIVEQVALYDETSSHSDQTIQDEATPSLLSTASQSISSIKQKSVAVPVEQSSEVFAQDDWHDNLFAFLADAQVRSQRKKDKWGGLGDESDDWLGEFEKLARLDLRK